jgi:transporter family protein
MRRSSNPHEDARMAANPQWLAWALLSAGFAAATAILAKAGVQQVDADLATLLRTVVITALLAGFVALTGKWKNPLSLPPATLGLLAASALATGASWVCYFRALKLGEASRVAAVDKLSLALVALFALVFLHERLDARGWLGVALVVAGIVLLGLRK